MASKTLSERETKQEKTKVNVVDIVRHDGQLMVPEKLSIDDAIEMLQKHKAHLEQPMTIRRGFDTFPWDGAAALQRVFMRRYGWVPAQAIPGLFSATPPATIAIETSLGVTEQVPWGRFGLPGMVDAKADNGWLQTGVESKDGRMIFSVVCMVKRKFQEECHELLADLEDEITTHSIYRGKAVRIRFCDDDGENLDMPEVKFIATDVTREQLVFARDLEAAIETNLFTPIERARDCERNGIPVKRGVLLGGPFGTGKTLAAAVAANIATSCGVTYVYVQRADELSKAIAFARQYDSPACVVFCEDVDRVLAGERDATMDDLLNIVDGIDGKRSRIVVVLTTNQLHQINQAMLRPGRLDAVLEVLPPDAEAVERLLRMYGGAAISADEDLAAVGEELAGNIPAVLTEVVKRAKLAELRRTPRGELIQRISAAALLEAAHTMNMQLRLLKPRDVPAVPTLDSSLEALIKRTRNGEGDVLHGIAKKVDDIYDQVS